MKKTGNFNLKKLLVPLITVLVTVTLVVTGLLWFGVGGSGTLIDGVNSGEATTSATYNDPANGTNYATSSTKLVAGDYINFNYTGSYKYIVLPQGEYKFYAYGAQGSTGGYGQAGGKGAYVYGTYTVTAATVTLYIYVGGTGGWNGGGSGGTGRSSNNGGVGGGATDVRLNTTALSGRLMVAAGGGGSGGGSQGGGSSKGTNGGAGGASATAGSQGGSGTSAEGRGGNAGSASSGGSGGSSSYTSMSNTDRYYYPAGGGGGGGGYYGGGGGGGGGIYGGSTNRSGSSGSAGSSGQGGSGGAGASYGYAYYCGAGGGGGGGGNYTGGVTSSGVTNGNRAGNGYFQIYVVRANQEPVTLSKTYSGGTRGTGKSVVVKASEIAKDPDGTATAVYFTDNVSSNYDTCTQGGFKLYLNSACTTQATNYIDYTVNNTSQITITNIKKIPRNGVDGCTSAGRLTLYCKVRDAYNTSTTRGVGTIVFYLTVSFTTPTAKSAVTLTTGGTSPSTMYVGNSARTSAPESATVSSIYNPKGTGIYTAMITQPIKLSKAGQAESTVVINPGDLLNNVATTYDMAAIALRDVSAIDKVNSSRIFKVNEYDNNAGITAYTEAGVKISNIFTQLTLCGVNSKEEYQVLPVTLYILEKASAKGTNYGLPAVAAINLEIVFKVDNTRPTVKDTSSTIPVVTLNASAASPTKKSLNDFYVDIDNSTMNTNTHRITAVKVPSAEFVQLDKYGKVVSTAMSNGTSYYNAVPLASLPSRDALTNALTTGELTTADNTFATGFESWFISEDTNSSAFVSYSFDGIDITLKGLRATYSMYKSARTSYTSLISGSTAGVTTSNCSGSIINPGHFYILINVQDKNDTDDLGIWLPLGIEVTNSTPTNISYERGSSVLSTMPTASGNGTAADGTAGESFYFTPMGINVDRVTYPLGQYKNAEGTLVNTNLHALSTDIDNYATSSMLSGTTDFLNELVRLNTTATAVMEGVAGNSTGHYFTVENLDIYIPAAYFGGRLGQPENYSNGGTLVKVGEVDYVVIAGLKVTLKNWTQGRYLYAPVNIKDSASATQTVYIAVYVNNSAPTYIKPDGDTTMLSDSVATLDIVSNGKVVHSSYTVAEERDEDSNSVSFVPTLTYKIPYGDSVIITPYDVLNDLNMRLSGITYPTGGFTLNGLSGYVGTDGVFSVNGSQTTNSLKFDGLATSDNNGVDYSHPNYLASLKETLAAITATHSLSRVADNNSFATPSGSVNVSYDKLYFERTIDADNLDGYTFDPNSNSAQRNVFTIPSIINASYIDLRFGSNISWDNATYGIDFLVISGRQRTPSGVTSTFTLNVRDKTGRGASGASSGIAKINVNVEVLNSTPHLKDPNKIYELVAGDVSRGMITLAASGDDGILTDTEDLFMAFIANSASVITVSADNVVSSTDAYGNNFAGNYVSVTINAQTLTITALNSSQAIQKLYIEFRAVDDYSATESSTLRIQIQISNAKMTVNTTESGFTHDNTANLNIWSVNSVTETDMTMERYLVSSEAAANALKEQGIADGQIKYLVSDADRLQGAILAPVEVPDPANVASDQPMAYINKPATLPEGKTIKDYVPYLSTTARGFDGETTVGVYLNWVTRETSSDPESFNASIDNGMKGERLISAQDIIYLIDSGEESGFHSASAIRAGTDTVNLSGAFDSEGRWNVKDWAIKIQTRTQFDAGLYLQINVMLRDDPTFGGDTAAVKTSYDYRDPAYATGGKSNVDGYVFFKYHLTIKGTGLVTYDYYDNFNGYYTVSDDANPQIVYLPTYDSNALKTFPTPQDNLYYVPGSKDEGVINAYASQPGGSTLIKERSSTTAVNGTFGGVNSGMLYSDFEPGRTTFSNGEAPFKYTNIIEVSGDTANGAQFTYIPMSYMGLMKALLETVDDDGVVNYKKYDYVAYDVDAAQGYSRGTIGDIVNAITVRDGTEDGVWSGTRLFENPYLSFTAYDAYIKTYNKPNIEEKRSVADYNTFIDTKDGPYFNKALHVSTVTKNLQGEYEAKKYINNSENYVNYVGNGHLMYLDGQDSDAGIQENMFGIGIAKKTGSGTKRASVENLTVSIKLAVCKTDTPSNAEDTTMTGRTYTAYTEDTKDTDTAEITFHIDLGNAPMDLVADDNIKIDAAKGYYTEVRLQNGGAAATFKIDNHVNPDTLVSGERLIKFTDADSSDTAHFYPESLNRLNKWTGAAYRRTLTSYSAETASSGSNYKLKYTATSDNAQRSMFNYYGVAYDRDREANLAKIEENNFRYAANDGIYGTNRAASLAAANGNEGYSRYFSAAFMNDNEELTITPVAKTLINKDALEAGYSSASGSNIREKYINFYAERGLVPVFESPQINNVVDAYYPLNVILYDDCGDGWDRASYVALEIRVYVTDSVIKLASGLNNTNKDAEGNDIVDGNKTMELSLAVGSDYILNLSSIITGNDIMPVTGQRRWWKTDYDNLRNATEIDDKFTYETANYIVSPFVSWTSISKEAANNALRRGDATFTDTTTLATDDQPDITIGMVYDTPSLTNRSVPITNDIKIHVNRRTIYQQGNTSHTQSEFEINLVFYDSGHYTQGSIFNEGTGTLTIKITVTNKTPELRTGLIPTEVTMRVEDHFRLMTTPYDDFMSGAASNSVNWYNRGENIESRDQSFNFSHFTRSVLADPATKVRNATVNDGAKADLGTAAIVTDDTPWTLRIKQVVYNEMYFQIRRYDNLAYESNTDENGALNIVITALRTTPMRIPISVVVTDGEGADVTFTVYVSVESSKPNAIARKDTSSHGLNEGLEFITDVNGNEVLAEYALYMTVYDGTARSQNITLNDNANTVVKAYNELIINAANVAYDPDYNDNLSIGLYTPTASEGNSVFTFNNTDIEMSLDGNYEVPGKFLITPLDGNLSRFSIRCLSYNSSKNYETLSFRIKDVGNNIAENAVTISIRIYTLYASMSNAHAISTSTSQITRLTVDNVYVKSYDEFMGIGIDEGTEAYAHIGEESTYQFLKYGGVPGSIDQDSTKSGAYIIDPDVSLNTYNLNYDIKIYAFMEGNGTDGFNSLEPSSLTTLFDANVSNGTFALKNRSDSTFDIQYLIGGRRSTGASYDSLINRQLLMYLRDYFVFSIGRDGVSISFRPITSNFDKKILLYVDIQKTVDASRTVAPKNAQLSAGSLFYVDINDSRPIANDDETIMRFEGQRGDSATFTIFDNDDPYGSLFSDSDVGDEVIVKGRSRLQDHTHVAANDFDYDLALSGTTLDWAAGSNKDRAIDISVDNEEHTLTVTIKRRIDEKDVNGNYKPKVVLPVTITGVDHGDKTATVTLLVTIVNSEMSIDFDALQMAENNITEQTNNDMTGYRLLKGDNDYSFTLEVLVSIDCPSVEVRMLEMFNDPDYRNPVYDNVDNPADTDSFRLVAPDDRGNYLTSTTNIYSVAEEAEDRINLATVTPRFIGNDPYKFTGIVVTANSYMRGYSGTATMRIIDRSGDFTNAGEGVTITLKVIIINSAPSLKEGMSQVNYSVIGTQSGTVTPITINIADFVTDPNPTDLPDQAGKTDSYVRITSFSPDMPEVMFATEAAEDDGGDGVLSVRLNTDDRYNQSCIVTPRKGVFGTQAIRVTVSDGTANDIETRTTTFSVRVTVVYNFDEITSFNTVNAIRGIYKTVTVEDLVGEVENTATGKSSPRRNSGIATYAEGDDERPNNMFNPGAEYVITKLSVPNTFVDYVRVDKDEDDQWRFRPMRVTTNGNVTLNAEFMLGSEVGKENARTYSASFEVSIAENPKPVLIDAFANGYTFYTSGNGYILVEGTVNLRPEHMFTDKAIAYGDKLRFHSASTLSPSLATAEVVSDDTLRIHFNYKGETELTVGVKDATDEVVTFTFKIINIDLEDPSLWANIMISFESNKMIWIIALGAVGLLIIILIIILIAVKHRKRKMEEMEAILMSELELEEQMMRLQAGSMGMMGDAYGYLPPTMGAAPVDPGLMLGGGPQQNPPGTLSLNAGQQQPGAPTQNYFDGGSNDLDF